MSCHWLGVVVELTVNRQPRCRTGNGRVHIHEGSTSGRDFWPFLPHPFTGF